MVFEVGSTLREPPSTFFAPPERSSDLELRGEAEQCLANPVACFLMESMDGLVLILDGNRQVLATNDRVRDVVGTAVEPMGHRPGELFGCIHHQEGPSGCGTSAACAHCGAVATILEVQRTGRAVEGECLLTLRSGELTQSAEFALAASPLQVGLHTFMVVVLHDQSALKRREALERLFFHDVANLMQGIRSWAELLASDSITTPGAAQKVAHLTDLLDRELRSHRAMALAEQGGLQPKPRAVLPLEILRDAADLVARHTSARDRKVQLLPAPELLIHTDPELLSRVVLNMAVNAVEASAPGETVSLSAALEEQAIRFQVHNPGEIPVEHRSQIFQRSFSTKGSPGRGLGTYAMKLFGENVLGGRVGFETGVEGTSFWIRLAR